VLVDAPCSGLGTLRRNPDLKWRQTEQDISELTAKQASILERAARLVKDGGRLVYATCSLLADENEQIAAAFLAAHPEFSLLSAKEILAQQHIELDTGDYFRLFPHLHQTDGFFAAAFEKKPASVKAEQRMAEQKAEPADEKLEVETPAKAKKTVKTPAKKPAAKKTAVEKAGGRTVKKAAKLA